LCGAFEWARSWALNIPKRRFLARTAYEFGAATFCLLVLPLLCCCYHSIEWDDEHDETQPLVSRSAGGKKKDR
jgi:hypothetical protein